MTGTLVATVICAAFTLLPGVLAQQRSINGLFIATKQGELIELIAYAEPMSRAVLRMQTGSLEDAPTIHELLAIYCNIPLWRPVGVFVSTGRIFSDDRAEQRNLAFTTRPRSVYGRELRVSDLARRDKIERLLKSAKASANAPGYAFVVLATDSSYRRYYPIRLTPDER